ncbi:hypothetical protein MP228_005072 [Amoeboaphelidium protococcarum]|nr:hypothetical protein MP228_005072 [Amoeboaphelidium protococcarum]
MNDFLTIIVKVLGLVVTLACFHVAVVSNESHFKFNESEVKDPFARVVVKLNQSVKAGALLMYAVAFLIYIVPPLRIYRWLTVGGLYDAFGRIRQWSFVDTLSIILVLVGCALRISAYRALGQYFTYVVTIKDEHKLITNGPYQYLVHPSYTALLLVTIGMQLYHGTRSWIVVLNTALFTGAVLYRIQYEEEALQQYFGRQYQEFIDSRYRLIPFLY